jgi:hypothetical protein
MNNMGREIMAALKRFQVGSDGDGVTVGGALVVSGATTLTTVSATVVQSDTVSEKTSAAGVTIDGVLLKDSGVVTGAGTVSAPVYSTTGDLNTGIFFPAADTIAFAEGGAEAMRITSDGDVGIGTSSPSQQLDVVSTSGFTPIRFKSQYSQAGLLGTDNSAIWMGVGSDGLTTRYRVDSADALTMHTNNTERMRIDSGGNVLIGSTTATADDGYHGFTTTYAYHTARDTTPLYINRKVSDGTLIQFRQDNADEGSISVSGTTVSYNGGHLSRWAQLTTPKDDTPLFKGTVMSNLDEMNVYIAPTTYWTEEDELPEGVNVGDVKVETHEVENEQLNKVKVSDVEGDANVAGVFVNWTYDEAHQVDEINMAMTGDMIIRIAQGTTVARGDLLMSAGDGTAKPQGDDIVRSKTIAKVTSTHVTCTYDDGSYCVPCVLMAC